MSYTYLFLLILFGIHSGHATEESFSDKFSAPLMPLSQELLVTLSRENKEKFIENKEFNAEIADQDFNAFQQRSIPWELLLSALAVIAAWIVILNTTEKKQLNISPVKSAEELLKESKEKIHAILKDPPTDPMKYSSYLIQLDEILRTYLIRKYQLTSVPLTTEELIKKLNVIKQANPSTIELFTIADKIKYGNDQSIQEDYLKTIHQSQRLYM